MTSPVRSVVVRLSMDPTSYVAGAAKAERSTLALEAAAVKAGATGATSMERAAAGATRASGAFGGLKKMLEGLGVSMPLLGAITGGVVVKMAADYQTLVTRLETTAGELHSNLKLVGDGMLDMAGQVGLSASELAKGMYTVEQSGFRGADALDVLKASAQGARQEGAELGKVVDAVSTVLHDYHLPASEAAHATSQLVAAISHSKTSFDDFTGAMHSITPLAAATGISLAQISGALASMTASGMHADQAAQNLASSIRSFSKPTQPMINQLAQLDLNAQDLQAHLGERGVAGTLQMVSDAIVRHMGPAGEVALSAINKNKIALNDLEVMIQNMPPELARMSQGLIDGSVSWKDYRSSVRDMSGQAAAMGSQFLGLYGSANGFSQILKSGGPAVQTYIGALGKAVGTAEGLSVALQLTGENAGAANAAIADISKAAGDAQGNIKGWDEVQHTFNQRLKEAEHAAGALAITAGQQMLPLLTTGLGWIADHGPQAMDALRGGISGVETVLGPFVKAGEGLVHLFGELPGPVKDTVLALVGLKVATSLNFLGLASGLATVKTSLAGAAVSAGSFSEQMAVQQRLMQMEQADAQIAAAGIGALDRAFIETAGAANAATAGLTSVQRMLFSLDAALAETVIAEDAAAASTGRLSAAMATMQARGGAAMATGLGAVRTAGSGLLSMLGGPWGVAFLGATIGVTSIVSALNAQAEAEKQAKTSGQELFNTYVKLGTVYGQQAAAARQSVIDQNHLDEVAQRAGISQDTLTLALQGNVKAQKEVTDATGGMGDRWHALWSGSFGDFLSGNFMSKDKDVWNNIVQGLGANADAANLLMHSVDDTKGALEDYQSAAQRIFGDGNIANRGVSTLQKGMDELAASAGDTQKSLQGITDILDGLTGKGVTAAQATADLTTATIDTTKAFAEMTRGAIDSTGAIDLHSKAGLDLWNSLKDVSSGFKTAVNDAYNYAGGLGNAKEASKAAGLVAGQLYEKFMLTATGAGMGADEAANLAKQLGLVPGDVVTQFTQPGMSASQIALDQLKGKILDTPDSKTIHTSALTQDTINALQAVGDKVTTLPDGTVLVTADTGPALNDIEGLIAKFRNAVIGIRIAPTMSGMGGALAGPQAIGHIVHQFASGGFEPMQAGLGQIVPPNTWRIVGDRAVDDEAYIPINDSARSRALWVETGRRMGLLGTAEQPAPVRTREMAGVGGGSSSAGIDYGRLAAAMAAVADRRPTVGQMVVQKESTAREAVDYLTAIARTGH